MWEGAKQTKGKLENFQFTVESNSGLDLFYFNILLD